MASRREGSLLAFAVVWGNRSTHLLCVYHIWKNFYAHIKPVCVDGSFEGEWGELVAARKKSMLLALITELEQHALSVECKSATNAIRTALLAATTAQRGGGETAIMATAREIVAPFGYALMAQRTAVVVDLACGRDDLTAEVVEMLEKKRAAAVNSAPAPKYALPGAVAGLPAPAPPLLVQATAPLEAEDEPVDLAFFDRPPTRIPTWFDELLSTDAPLNAAACQEVFDAISEALQGASAEQVPEAVAEVARLSLQGLLDGSLQRWFVESER
ncbi:hypothetical protein M885DRAFT_571699 [Pelagophyceae sp. CCMP2097]|nr:hypothetical protein M885DRAFT_571699 [Pelagophyceae sp. CCMP2097]